MSRYKAKNVVWHVPSFSARVIVCPMVPCTAMLCGEQGKRRPGQGNGACASSNANALWPAFAHSLEEEQVHEDRNSI